MEWVLVEISYTLLVGPQGKRKWANEFVERFDVRNSLHDSLHLEHLKFIDTIY
jgi:hypothetical protein